MFKICRNTEIRYTFPRVKLDLGISIFFYNPKTGEDFIANQLGAMIWHIIKNGKTYNEIIDEITDETKKIDIDIDQIKLKEDVHKVCNIMFKQKLVKYIY